jgi:hypothetical protein
MVQSRETLQKYASAIAQDYLDAFSKVHVPRHLVKEAAAVSESLRKYAENIALVNVVSEMREWRDQKLLKQSAAVDNSVQTVDAILSLGFLNPQNLQVFLGYQPELEQALNHLCELLMASRIGLGLNEGQLKVCVEALDTILSDLEYISANGQSQTTALNRDDGTPTLTSPEALQPPQPQSQMQQAPQDQGQQPQPQQQAAQPGM